MIFNQELQIRRCIELILRGENHREILDDQITRMFLVDAVEMLSEVAIRSTDKESVDLDWYKKSFIEDEVKKERQAAHGGTSIKSISNKRKTTKKSVVLEESLRSFEAVRNIVNELSDTELSLKLSLERRKVKTSMNLNESLVLINALALRRNQIRGGRWSSFGKRVEQPLLIAMCRIFKVPPANYLYGERKGLREVDFSLLDQSGNRLKCEVKLMGRGNPEGADSLYARDTNVFIASTLSKTNIQQLDNEGREWVELRQPFGFLRFGDILKRLQIPHSPVTVRGTELEKLIHLSVTDIEIDDTEFD